MEKEGPEEQRLRDYINFLLSKGYTKDQVKEKLIEKGFDRFLIKKIIYPNLKLLVASGIIFIIMILIIGGFFVRSVFFSNNLSNDLEENLSANSSIAEDLETRCQMFINNPEKYERSGYFEDLKEQCDTINMAKKDISSCEMINDEKWKNRCKSEIELFGYFRSEELLNEELGGLPDEN